MPTVTIRDLPEDIINIHKRMAAINDRSFEGHLRFVLREVIARRTFDCDNDAPIPFHRDTVVEYLKAFVQKYGQEPTHFRIPYRGLIWHAIYNWDYDERGRKDPWALEDGEKFFGMTVELVPAIADGTQEGSLSILGSLTTFGDITKPPGDDAWKTKHLYIHFADVMEHMSWQQAPPGSEAPGRAWKDVPIGRKFEIVASTDLTKIGTQWTKLDDVEAVNDDGHHIACEPSNYGYEVLPEE